MTFTVLDTTTGETREVSDLRLRVFDLAEGNWNCDYNRAKWFGAEIEDSLPDDSNGEHVCHQGKDNQSLRFRITAVEDWDGEDPVELDYLN